MTSHSRTDYPVGLGGEVGPAGDPSQRLRLGSKKTFPAAISLVFILVTACSGNGAQTNPSPSGKTSAPVSVSATSADATEVLTVYRRLQDLVTAAFAHPERNPSPLLERYAYGRALADVYETVFSYRQEGVRVVGRPVISPEVTSMDLDARPKSAVITDCFDGRNWTSVDSKTGKPVSAPSQNLHYVIIVRVQRIKGRWFVVSASPDRSRTC